MINLSHDQGLIRKVLDDACPGPDAPRGVALTSLDGGLDDPERFVELLKRFEGRPDVREGDLKRLGDILGTDDRYRIGPFDPVDFDPESFLRVFAGAPRDVMRCAEIVGHLCEEKKRAGAKEGQINRFRKNVLPQLLGALPPGRLVGVLNSLTDRDESDPSARGESRAWFARYLRSAVKEPGFLEATLPARWSTPMSGGATTAWRSWAGATPLCATRSGNGPGTTTATGCVRCTTTRWRGSDRCCGVDCARTGGSRRRSFACIWAFSVSSATSGPAARVSWAR